MDDIHSALDVVFDVFQAHGDGESYLLVFWLLSISMQISKILHSVTDVNVCLGIKYHDSSAFHR